MTPTPTPTPTTTAPASSSAAAPRFPRTPTSTAIGDPVTADLCAEVPLSAFAHLGYAPAYAAGVVPPGCAVAMRTSGELAFTVYAYGVGSNSFSHLSPTSASDAKPISTRTESGIKVAVYAFDRNDGGACARDVLAQGLTLSVFAVTESGAGRPDEKANCGAADAMAALMARASAKGSAPRLQLASRSLTDLDFCAVLRATTISDINGFAGEPAKPDGVGDGCEVDRGDSFTFYVDFAIRNDRHPSGSTRVTAGGHVLYRGEPAGSGMCKYISTQGRTPGGFEVVSFYVSDTSSSAPTDLCAGAATAAARFLDTAGLT